jgi:hypothetical protein
MSIARDEEDLTCQNDVRSSGERRLDDSEPKTYGANRPQAHRRPRSTVEPVHQGYRDERRGSAVADPYCGRARCCPTC